MEWRRAIALAKDIRLLLQPCCERVEIAGSLRRIRSEVNDLEIVAIPKRDPFDRLQLMVTDLVANRRLFPGPESKDGKRPPLGPRYYRLTVPMGESVGFLQLDLFAVLPPADWGVIYTIRTGSAQFSHWIVTEALRRGFKVDGGQLWKIHHDEQPWRFEHVPCPDELSLFDALGIPWVAPQDREPGRFPPITIPGLAPGLAVRQPNSEPFSSTGTLT